MEKVRRYFEKKLWFIVPRYVLFAWNTMIFSKKCRLKCFVFSRGNGSTARSFVRTFRLDQKWLRANSESSPALATARTNVGLMFARFRDHNGVAVTSSSMSRYRNRGLVERAVLGQSPHPAPLFRNELFAHFDYAVDVVRKSNMAAVNRRIRLMWQ